MSKMLDYKQEMLTKYNDLLEAVESGDLGQKEGNVELKQYLTAKVEELEDHYNKVYRELMEKSNALITGIDSSESENSLENMELIRDTSVKMENIDKEMIILNDEFKEVTDAITKILKGKQIGSASTGCDSTRDD